MLELLSSTAIFLIDINYSSNDAMLLCWGQRYNNVVITIWLTVTKYPYLKWQWIFYFLRILFPFLNHLQDFIEPDYISE
jgi:hypothetical protein